MTNVWNFQKPSPWWHNVVIRGWSSRLPFKAKLFIWWIMLGGLPVADALRKIFYQDVFLLYNYKKIAGINSLLANCSLYLEIQK